VAPLESLRRPSYQAEHRTGSPSEWLFEKEEWDDNQKPELGTHAWIKAVSDRVRYEKKVKC
jgi:hypothetical protein